MWLEMSRDEARADDDWGLGRSVWSPTRKVNGTRWAFWSTIQQIRMGDVVVHLRGKPPFAVFVGYSVAASDGAITDERPSMNSRWSYSSTYYRAKLEKFTPFIKPLPLVDIFRIKEAALRSYFEENKNALHREHIFFVIQSGKLQCLNGAYLSRFGKALADIVLRSEKKPNFSGFSEASPSTVTSELLAQVRQRIGQQEFSNQVRQNYGHKCCFPGCSVADGMLLVGAHIARWADAEHLRGKTSNGVCLCLFHDRAFEHGLFTLTRDFRIQVNPAKIVDNTWGQQNIAPFDRQKISLGLILPSLEALALHQARIGFGSL